MPNFGKAEEHLAEAYKHVALAERAIGHPTIQTPDEEDLRQRLGLARWMVADAFGAAKVVVNNLVLNMIENLDTRP